MDDRLGVNVDVNPGGRQTKKPMRFNNFQAFVHQSGGVDGDPPPHLPDGMLQRLLGCQAVKSLARSVKKWTAGRRQDDAADFPLQPGAQTLVNRRVFAVNRQDLDGALAGGARYQLSRHHQHFLRSQPNPLAGQDRLVGGRQARHAMRR